MHAGLGQTFDASTPAAYMLITPQHFKPPHTHNTHAGLGQTFDASTPAAYMLYVSDAVQARAASHKLGGSGYLVSLLDAVVGQPAPSHVSWGCGQAKLNARMQVAGKLLVRMRRMML
jgi:hypothetical protein